MCAQCQGDSHRPSTLLTLQHSFSTHRDRSRSAHDSALVGGRWSTIDIRHSTFDCHNRQSKERIDKGLKRRPPHDIERRTPQPWQGIRVGRKIIRVDAVFCHGDEDIPGYQLTADGYNLVAALGSLCVAVHVGGGVWGVVGGGW